MHITLKNIWLAFSLHSGRSLFYVFYKFYFTFSSTLSSPRVSVSGISSPIWKYASKHTNVNVCGRKNQMAGWMGWYIHTYNIFRGCTCSLSASVRNINFPTLMIRHYSYYYYYYFCCWFHSILLYCCTFFCPPSRSQFYIHSIRSSVLLYVYVSVLVGKSGKFFIPFFEKLYVWVFHPHWACRKYIHNQFYFVVLQLIVLTMNVALGGGMGWRWWWK